MKVLVVGSGGREHALCWAIAKSANCEKLYAAPGNAGISGIADCVPIGAEDLGGLVDFAKSEGIDVLLIDTAGRLQNKKDLMAELEKIIRVIGKLDETAPHDCLLVLDATVGQNAHSQVEVFKDMVDVSGLMMTKLDGTARGGVVVALAEKFGLPVHAVGVGEGADDMRPFEARAFARSLMGLS